VSSEETGSRTLSNSQGGSQRRTLVLDPRLSRF